MRPLCIFFFLSQIFPIWTQWSLTRSTNELNLFRTNRIWRLAPSCIVPACCWAWEARSTVRLSGQKRASWWLTATFVCLSSYPGFSPVGSRLRLGGPNRHHWSQQLERQRESCRGHREDERLGGQTHGQRRRGGVEPGHRAELPGGSSHLPALRTQEDHPLRRRQDVRWVWAGGGGSGGGGRRHCRCPCDPRALPSTCKCASLQTGMSCTSLTSLSDISARRRMP